MDIHGVVIDGGGVVVLHGDGPRMDFKCAVGLAMKAGDKEAVFDLITRLEALVVHDRAIAKATSELLAACKPLVAYFEARWGYLAHRYPPVVAACDAIANAEKKGD